MAAARLTPVLQPVEQPQRIAQPPRQPGAQNGVNATDSQSDEIDFLQLLGVIWRGKWIILLFALVSALGAGYYAFEIAEPRYAATARLALQVRDQQIVDLESVISGVSTEQAAINTELEVIRSRGLVERLVSELNLIDDPEFNPTLRDASGLSVANVKSFIKEVFGVAEPPNLVPAEDEIRRWVTDAVTKAISVSAQRNTYLFNIRVTTGEPRKSADMANRLAQIYLADQVGIKFSATEYAVDWLSGRVGELEVELKRKEDAVKDLRAETELVSLNALEALTVRAKDIRERLGDAITTSSVAREKVGQLIAIASSDDLAKIASVLNDPTLDRFVDAAAQGNTSAARAFRERLDVMMQREQANADRADSQRDALQISYDRLQGQIDAQNADLAKLNQLVREADTTRVLYETFLTRLKETSVQIGLQQADSRILSLAIPGVVVAPHKTRIVTLALLLAAIAGVGFVLFRQSLHDGLRTSEELETATQHAVLGQIPRLPIRRRGRLVRYLRNKPTSAIAEAFRNLRTSVLLSNADDPPQIIMSTSSVPGEGKTTQAIALAHNLSSLGKRVLLVECDIRRRAFAQYFNAKPTVGLAEVVQGEIAFDDAVLCDQELGADILMGAKSSVNAADLFSSNAFGRFIEVVRDTYDFVVVDTPPVLVVPDARIIGRFADVILYSVCWNRTPKSQVVEGLRQFTSVGLRVGGLVLSKVDPRGMKRYGYGGYFSYGRGDYDA